MKINAVILANHIMLYKGSGQSQRTAVSRQELKNFCMSLLSQKLNLSVSYVGPYLSTYTYMTLNVWVLL